jgi:hypothetical protein
MCLQVRQGLHCRQRVVVRVVVEAVVLGLAPPDAPLAQVKRNLIGFPISNASLTRS